MDNLQDNDYARSEAEENEPRGAGPGYMTEEGVLKDETIELRSVPRGEPTEPRDEPTEPRGEPTEPGIEEEENQ